MDTWVWIVIVAAVVVVAAIIVLSVVMRRRRTAGLRDRFGQEYERRLREDGSKRRAESRLVDVRDQHDQLDLRSLNSEARARYQGRWQELQHRFLDQPGHVLAAADVLVTEVLRERGYPEVQSFDEQVDLVALDHADGAGHYRAAHQTLERAQAGLAGTEEVRIALIQYRSLFEALLAAQAPDPEQGAEPAAPRSS